MDIRESAVLVTGAASGLGAAAVTRFAASGATVFALDLQAVDSGADPVQNVRRLTGDVTSSQEMADALGEIENSGLALRAVVTCAGVGWTQRVLSQWGTHGLDIFEKVLAVNVCGTFNVLRLAADVMARQPQCDVDGQRGVIVMTSSVAAFEGQIGQIAYSASKGAVHAMTIAAARKQRHPDARGAEAAREAEPGRECSASPSPRHAGGVRRAGGNDHRSRLSERRDGPTRWSDQTRCTVTWDHSQTNWYVCLIAHEVPDVRRVCTRMSLPGSAGHRYVDAGDPWAAVGREEGDHFGDVTRIPVPAQGKRGCRGRAIGTDDAQRCRGRYESWADRVDTNAVVGGFGGEPDGVGVEGSFRGGVMEDRADRIVRRHGRHVDHCPGFALIHVRQNRGGDSHGGKVVDRDVVDPLGVADVEDTGTRHRAPGVVDQNVDVPQQLCRVVDKCACPIEGAQICGDEVDVRAQVGRRGTADGDDNGSSSDEAVDYPCTDSLGAASHDSRLPGQVVRRVGRYGGCYDKSHVLESFCAEAFPDVSRWSLARGGELVHAAVRV